MHLNMTCVPHHFSQLRNKTSQSFSVDYLKVPKFSNARNFAVIHLKFKQRPNRVFCQNGIANNEDPVQTVV